ncbi:succinyl-diaminopimelate desuccinylase [Helicobacter sp. faydin-H20]|uniref:succinyl-diaminopimelate desuccinylase n=1 Tax=Helicobacter anatolicus TaxID=2905874 RepID=UPI001E4CB803|nr:succinyl-diaminopimelate desuccinylase [Helicobacter anatolicus]MCE3036903.1 succinyl-diaminopimelate desuccinylase [Helicobacter anatolicus]
MSVVEILKKLVSYPTITPKECDIYTYIKNLLPDFEALSFNKNEVKNLFLYKVYGDLPKNTSLDNLMHLCFAGHVDVVPAGEGWGSDPFVPMLKDNKIYGRGTQDMKGGIAGFLDALMQNTYKITEPKIISILLTSDEEGVGVDGTRYVLEELKKINLLPHFAIVAEPTSSQEFGDTIKIGRRGSINGVLRILGKQGHVAYPEKCINPVEVLGERLGMLAGVNLDNGDEFFAPSKLVITDIRGGMEVVNVTPNDLKIMFNVRNSTLTTKESVEKYLIDTLKGIDYHLELKQSSYPFRSLKDGFLVKNFQEILQNLVGKEVKLSTSGGTSDARFFAQHQIEVIEFGVINDKIHSIDECVEIKELELLSQVFLQIIQKFLGVENAKSNFNEGR